MKPCKFRYSVPHTNPTTGEDVILIVDAWWEDVGIGPYECHGFKGCDTRYEAQWELITALGAHAHEVYDNEKWRDAITEDVEKLLRGEEEGR